MINSRSEELKKLFLMRKLLTEVYFFLIFLRNHKLARCNVAKLIFLYDLNVERAWYIEIKTRT